MDKQDYLNMQINSYNEEAGRWSLNSRDPVVGSYDSHNSFTDYENFLFKELRNRGLFDKIYKYTQREEDKALSL